MKAVYTAVIGNYDKVADPIKIEGWDYILFTDNKNIKSDVWDVRVIEREKLSPVKQARKIKILYHKYVGEYDEVLWVDGNIVATKDFSNLFDRAGNICLMQHGRNCIYDEADACKERNKDSKKNIDEQIAFYRSEGVPKKLGMVNTGIMLRKKDERVVAFMEEWWKMVEKFSHRDQLSFNYIMWKHPNLLKPTYFPYQLDSKEIFYKKSHAPYEPSENIGVVILALGNPLYGEFASNLAISIRAYSDIPVTVLHDNSSLTTIDSNRVKMFNKILIPKEEFTYKGVPVYQRVKTRLYDYSPYDETLYIDADSLITRDVKKLFTGSDFSIGSMGYYDCQEEKIVGKGYWFWADPLQLKKHYKLKNKIGKTYSGIMCWRKGEVAEKMFKAATKVYDDRTNRKLTKTWGGDIGDELCFNVAIGLTEAEPVDWMPIYFEPYHGSLRHAQMLEYHGITLAGNEPPPYVATLYKEKCREHAYRLGIRFIMPTNKKDALGVRKTW